jgi:hypothetical protein
VVFVCMMYETLVLRVGFERRFSWREAESWIKAGRLGDCDCLRFFVAVLVRVHTCDFLSLDDYSSRKRPVIIK